MITATVLIMVVAVAAVSLGGIAFMARSRSHTSAAGSASDASAGWMPATFTGGSGGDCSAADAGCDGGGGGGE